MHESPVSRREFLVASALAASTLAIRTGSAASLGGGKALKVGVIGCGGRGTGAVHNSLDASPDTMLWAMGDVFPDRLEGSYQSLSQSFGARVEVPKDRRFSGFEAYKSVIASGVDVVLLCTPPHFRPMHFEAAIAAGKHVFMEKPVAVDPAGIRKVLAAGEAAKAKNLSVVAGTQRRHETSYLEAMQRIHAGDIGTITHASCFWNQGGLWNNARQPEWSDMEWQLRNWLYFAWLSGDHICEQHVHNLDVMNWALRSHPIRAMGMGGRQSRTGREYGHVYDHFAIEYEYPGGVIVNSMCRQVDGCAGRVAESLTGTEGNASLTIGRASLTGKRAWKFTGKDNEPYTQEHVDLIASIQSGAALNEAKNVAESTMTAIMGRLSAYTGQSISWEQAMNSTLDLTPEKYELGPLATADVAIPGTTKFV